MNKMKTMLVRTEEQVVDLPYKKLEIIRIPMTAILEETTAYSEGHVSNGYGSAGGVHVKVTKGGEAHLNIDFTITAVSEEEFNSWKSDVQQYFTQEQKKTLEENYGAIGFMGGYFSAAFGIIFGGGDYNHYMNSSDSYHTESDEKKEGFAKRTYDLQQSTFHVTGTLDAVGLSNIPTEVSAYVELTKFQFADNTTKYVFDSSNPIAADSNGNTSNVASKPTKLNVVKI